MYVEAEKTACSGFSDARTTPRNAGRANPVKSGFRTGKIRAPSEDEILARGRGAWFRFGVLGAVLAAACVHFHVYGLANLMRDAPREDDVVFQSLPRGDLVDAIEGITGSPFRTARW